MADIIGILRGDGFAWLRMIWGDRRRRIVRKGAAGRWRAWRRKAAIDALDLPEKLRYIEEETAWIDANADPEELAAILERRVRQAGRPAVYAAGRRREAMETFELMAVVDAFDSLLAEMDWLNNRRVDAAVQKALDLYYEGEELLRDSDDEHAKALYQEVRESIEKAYGGPLPPRQRN